MDSAQSSAVTGDFVEPARPLSGRAQRPPAVLCLPTRRRTRADHCGCTSQWRSQRVGAAAATAVVSAPTFDCCARPTEPTCTAADACDDRGGDAIGSARACARNIVLFRSISAMAAAGGEAAEVGRAERAVDRSSSVKQDYYNYIYNNSRLASLARQYGCRVYMYGSS